MNIQKISSANNIKFASGKIETPSEKKSTGEEHFEDNKKIALVLGALAAAGIAAVAIARSRKIPSEMSIEKFKKAGGFEKVENDGVTRTLAMYKKKPYTGAVKVSNKNGYYIVDYKDGVLKSSLFIEEFNPEGSERFAKASIKEYLYDEKGKLTGVNTSGCYNLANCTDKFFESDVINKGSDSGKNLAKYESGLLWIKDGEITVQYLTPELDAAKTIKTLFNKDGSFKAREISEEKRDKEEIFNTIEKAIKQRTETKNS